MIVCTPGRRALGYGPVSVTTLSPAMSRTRVGIGAPSGNVIVQPLSLDVALNTNVVGVVSPVSGTARILQRPEICRNEVGAPARGWAGSERVPLAVSGTCFRGSEQPAKTAILHATASVSVRCIASSGTGDTSHSHRTYDLYG